MSKNDTLTIILSKDTNMNYNKSFDKKMYVSPPLFFNYSYAFDEYRKINEIPKEIKTKTIKFLQKKINYNYFNEIYFKKGIVIDSNYLVNSSEKKNMKTKLEYYLCFAYSNIKKGIGEYVFIVKTDQEGKILNNIEFPTKSNHNNNIIQLEKIKEKAVKKGFFQDTETDIDLTYDINNNILVWVFTKKEHIKDVEWKESKLLYNAHNSKLITLKSEIMHIVE